MLTCKTLLNMFYPLFKIYILNKTSFFEFYLILLQTTEIKKIDNPKFKICETNNNGLGPVITEYPNLIFMNTNRNTNTTIIKIVKNILSKVFIIYFLIGEK